MISLAQHYQPAFLDGDLDSSLRVVHRLSVCLARRGLSFPAGSEFCIAPSGALR